MLPFAGLADHVFRTYHWTYDQWQQETPDWLWEEIQLFWQARQEIQRSQTKAPEAANTRDLIALAKQEGFDVDPAWEAEGSNSG